MGHRHFTRVIILDRAPGREALQRPRRRGQFETKDNTYPFYTTGTKASTLE